MVQVAGRDRVGMEFHAAEVDDPCEAGGVVDDDFVGGAAGGERERDGAQEGRQVVGCALLVEGLCVGAVDEALEDDGPVLNAVECAGSDGEKVADQIDLAELNGFREVQLVGVRDANLVSVDGQQFGVVWFCHEERLSGCGIGTL